MTFNPEAAKRYSQKAVELCREVQAFRWTKVEKHVRRPELYVSHVLTPDEIQSIPQFWFVMNDMGDRCGFLWNSHGSVAGWKDDAFLRIRDLAQEMAHKGPAKELVSDVFALEVICDWLRETLEHQRADSLPAYFAERCASAVREHEIWIPLFRTYAASEFHIGEVSFRTISKALMDKLQERAPESAQRAVKEFIDKKRAKWQGSLAACIRIKAERTKASQLARSAAKNATALLSFLSPANRNSRLMNFGTLLGSEMLESTTELVIESGAISSVEERVVDYRQTDWNIDRISRDHTWILPALHDLASTHSTDFRRDLYNALILYSRQARASELSDKLIFALSALESMLLRDSNEPIQKNLGERMAFLTENSVEGRKRAVRNIKAVYNIRSAFIHHGESPENQDALDQFLITTWNTFASLLRQRDKYKTKSVLLDVLEDLKMS